MIPVPCLKHIFFSRQRQHLINKKITFNIIFLPLFYLSFDNNRIKRNKFLTVLVCNMYEKLKKEKKTTVKNERSDSDT